MRDVEAVWFQEAVFSEVNTPEMALVTGRHSAQNLSAGAGHTGMLFSCGATQKKRKDCRDSDEAGLKRWSPRSYAEIALLLTPRAHNAQKNLRFIQI